MRIHMSRKLASSMTLASVCAGVAGLGYLLADPSQPSAYAAPCELDALQPSLFTGNAHGALVLGEDVVEEPSADDTVRNVTTTADEVSYVEDGRGADTLVVQDVDVDQATDDVQVGETSADVYQGSAELMQPATGSAGTLVVEKRDGGDVLLWLDGSLGLVGEHQPPPDAFGLAYPVWLDADTAVVAVNEPTGWAPTGYTPPEDAVAHMDEHLGGQSNLWSIELTTGVWTRLTSFMATLDHWVTVHTPTVTGGGIDVVRISGMTSGTADDVTYEHLRVTPGSAPVVVRTLPPETYLAGRDPVGGQLLASQYLAPEEGWVTGPLTPAGVEATTCGAARVDARDVDLDLAPDPATTSTTVAGVPGMTEEELDALEDVWATVFVGDYATAVDAEAALAQAESLPGDWVVLSAADAPMALAENRFALARADVAVPLTDLDEEFDAEITGARQALEADQVTGEVFVSSASGTALGVR
jgi:hypothetical protein